MGWFGNYGNKKDAFTSNVFQNTRDNIKDGKKLKESYPTLISLCHAWASENVIRGRSGSSMFFERGIIYSYGYHYRAAKIYTNKKGEKLVLINSVDYSNSTSNHLSEIRSATKHIKNIRVPYIDLDGLRTSLISITASHGDNLEYFSDLIVAEMALIFQARSSCNINRLEKLLSDLELYCNFFNIKMPFKMNDQTLSLLKECDKLSNQKSALRNSRIKENNLKRDNKLKQENEAVLNSMERAFPEHLQSWIDGELSDDDLRKYCGVLVKTKGPFGHEKRNYLSIDISKHKKIIEDTFKQRYKDDIKAFKDGDISANHIKDRFNLCGIKIDLSSQYASLRIIGNKVETSEGADVPLDHAIRLLKLVLKDDAKKGERVGLYTLETIKDDPKGDKTIIIGCHKILLSEAKSVLGPYKIIN